MTGLCRVMAQYSVIHSETCYCPNIKAQARISSIVYLVRCSVTVHCQMLSFFVDESIKKAQIVPQIERQTVSQMLVPLFRTRYPAPEVSRKAKLL